MKIPNQRITYSASDICQILGISPVGAYNLMHSESFPSFRVGKRILVTHDAFQQWLDEQQRKKIQNI